MFARLSPQKTAIFFKVAAKGGDWVRADSIIDDLWGDDPDGGPDNPLNAIASQVCQMRKAIGAFNVKIVGGGNGSPGESRYRLVVESA